MADEPFAEELAQRLALLIGMIMEDEVDGALTASLGRSAWLGTCRCASHGWRGHQETGCSS